MANEPAPLLAKILTVSDGVVAGTREDTASPALAEALTKAGFSIVESRAVADGAEQVANALCWMAFRFNGLIVTTGGTGFGRRDKTPEGTKRVLDRHASGLTMALVTCSPLGRLSRAIAGSRGQALIINVAGSPSGALEMLDAVIDVVPHALALMGGRADPHPSS